MTDSSIPLTPVASSNVKAVGFDPDRQIIAVEFNSGGLYYYEGCDQKLYDDLLAAGSIGRFVHTFLKPKGFVKVV